MLRRLILSTALVTAALLPAVAQAPSNVTVSASGPATVARGGKGTLSLTLKIKSGWHVYAADPGSSDYIATTVEAKGADGVLYGKPVFPKATTLKTSTDPKPLNVYKDTAVISVPFTVAKTAKPGKHTLSATVGYQTCNDSMCLPPDTIPVTASVTVK